MKKSLKKDGYVTVYLSLSLLVMLSLIFTLIEGIRMQTIRFQTECVMDMGLSSIFAEYHRKLWEQYDLLAMDTTYGYEQADEERTASHLRQYMNMNFTAAGNDRIPGYKDLTAVHADNAALSDISYLSDGKGMVLKYQIIQFMKEKTGLSFAEEWIPEDFLKKEAGFDGLESKRTSSHGLINEILEALNEARQEDEEEITISNPADQVESMREGSLLSMAVRNSGDISCKNVNVSSYISHRNVKEGAGLREGQNLSVGLMEKVLFQQYLWDKCGFYHKEKEEGALSYQLEYLLYGKGSDIENLEAFTDQVFKIRYVINAAHLFSSSSKMAEVSGMAAAVVAGISSPQLYEAVKITILFAWCYAESIQDMRILMDGKAVAAIKSDATWNVPLSELLMFTSSLDSYYAPQEGITYDDYLKSFLFVKEESIIRMRLMDLMEMDIRKTMGNQSFKMDACIYQLKAQVNVSSKYGYGYSILREYSYE